MYLPDKIVIDLYQIDLVVDKIAKLLKKIMKSTSCGQVVDVGNDIDYALKDITSFKKKLFNLLSNESKKYQTDIFGNVIQNFSNYRYAEIMFSEDYREITSIRMLGQPINNSYSRYSIFNLQNVFDPTTILLLNNAEDILENIKDIVGEETKYIEFLQNYFAPFPLFHALKEKDLKCLDNISKKYDDGKEKDFEDYVQQTKKFETISFKLPIYDKRISSFTQVSSLTFVLPQIDEILKKIETYQAADDPKKIIEIIHSTILDKFNIGDITSFVFDGLNIVIDPLKFIQDLEPIDIIEKIDDLPKSARDPVYKMLRDPNGPVNLDKIIIDLQEFINFKLNLENINLELSKLLNTVSSDIEKIKIPEILIELINLKVPEIKLQNPNFDVQNPALLEKLNKIKTKNEKWIFKIQEILNIFDSDPLVKNIPENQQTKTLLLNIKNDLNTFKDKINLIKLDLNFNIKLLEAYNFASNIKLPDLYFNLEQLINKKIKKNKCNIKLSKTKTNLKLTDLFKKIKLKFPNLYIDFEKRFNAIFPKADFLNELKNLINFDIFKIEIPTIELPKFKVPNFNIEIEDLFGSFSKQIDTSILNIISSILTEITKNLLELLNSLNKLDDFAMENMFPLPGLDIPNANVPKYETAFNEDWLIYVEYVYRLLTETDKQRTEPQIIKLPSSIVTNPAIRDKIKNRKILRPVDYCEPADFINKTIVSKKELKKRKINNMQDALGISDIESLLEKIKNYQYSDAHDYFRTENTDDDYVVDILRFIAKTLKETTNPPKPKLPVSSSELIKKTSDMVEQIETILDQKELNSLLNGTYSEETAEIVRNIAKINFPDLTYRVDPIKYFRMLGKVIGSKNNPKFDYKQALNASGVKK